MLFLFPCSYKPPNAQYSERFVIICGDGWLFDLISVLYLYNLFCQCGSDEYAFKKYFRLPHTYAFFPWFRMWPVWQLKGGKGKWYCGVCDYRPLWYWILRRRGCKNAYKEVSQLRAQMGDCVLAGVEIGEGIWHKKDAEGVLAGSDFDIVLGSVTAFISARL